VNTPPEQKCLAVFTNASWNLLNFRLDLLGALADGGYRLHLIVPDTDSRLSSYGEVHHLRMHPTSMNPFGELATVFRIKELLRTIRPDALLTYTIKPNAYGTLAAKSLGIPVICNITGLGESFGGIWYKRLVAHQLYRRAISKADVVFVQNRDDLAYLTKDRLIPAETAKLVPGSGINLTDFRPEPVSEENRKKRKFRFLFIGRLRVDKGFLEFIAAARQLLAEGLQVEFHVVGKCEAKRGLSISHGLIDELTRDKIITHHGFVQDIRPSIHDSDCVVLPSYREGLPRALLEAAAMAKPVIATEVPGCRDVLINGRTGIACEVRDADSLATAMRTMHSLPAAKRREMGVAGRQLVEDQFEVGLVIEKYLNELSRLTGGNVSVSENFDHDSESQEISAVIQEGCRA
jgi:glycosyltransferase involved in cell wall biosynthesis